MTSSAPQDTLAPLLAFVPLDAAAKSELCAHMSGADRHYHGVDHLARLWERHEQYRATAGLRSAEIDLWVACAIAYHDVVYDPKRRDNEERSADFWLQASGHGRVDQNVREWVAQTIRATSDHLAYAPDISEANRNLPLSERARLWMLDLDLTPLGEEPDVFDANVELLHAENAGVPTADFERTRLLFLRRFDNAPVIFRSPVLAKAFEATARKNLERHLGSPPSRDRAPPSRERRSRSSRKV